MSKQKKTFIAIAALIAVLITLNTIIWRTPKAKLKSSVITLEVAASRREQERGLMYRTNLPDDRGMLFIFSPARSANFWMIHTLIPLDMLFVKNGAVIKIEEAVPCSSESAAGCPQYGGVEATEVLEVAGGFAKRHNVAVGDRVDLDLRLRRPSLDELSDRIKKAVREFLHQR